MAKYTTLCTDILNNVGGKDNLTFATHCMTRLRINVKDTSLIDENAIKKTKGVIGCQFSGGQFQIIIGQIVDEVYSEFIGMTGLQSQSPVQENLDKKPFSWKELPSKILDVVAGCVTPMLPILTVAGVFKLLAALFGPSILGWMSAEDSFVVLCNFVGDTGFYFFPIYVAWAASKKFNTSTPIAMFLGAVLLHPTLLNMVTENIPFTVYGIPVTPVNYASQFLPSILITWILSYVYRFFDKISPKSLKVLLVPTCSVLVMLPIALCFLGPVGYYAGQMIASAVTWLYGVCGPLAVGLLGALWPFLIATGMHQALIALMISNVAVQGFDQIMAPGPIIVNYALIALALAYVLRGPKEDRTIAAANATTLIAGGISEPVIFSILLRYKQAMIALLAGGFAGGVLAYFLNVRIFFFGATNILCILDCGEDLTAGIICSVVAFVITFSIAMILGFSEKKVSVKANHTHGINGLVSPVSGQVIALSDVKDPAFSSGAMGQGCAIIPEKGEVRAPFDGTVLALFPTGHAIGLQSKDGVEVLIHIGIDTVNEQGNGFEPQVKNGDTFKKGDLLIRFDLDGLKQKGYDMTTPVLITSEQENIHVLNEDAIESGDALLGF